jgi:arsenate reductase
MNLTIYGICNCDSMKKARAWFDSHGMAYGFHDYKTKRQQSGEQNTWRSVTGLVNPATEPIRR